MWEWAIVGNVPGQGGWVGGWVGNAPYRRLNQFYGDCALGTHMSATAHYLITDFKIVQSSPKFQEVPYSD